MSSTGEKLLWDDAKFTAPSVIESITKVFAFHMLQQASMSTWPRQAPLIVLDNACGTAVVTSALHEMVHRPEDSYAVTCGDLAEAMVEAARQKITSEQWTNTTVSKLDAQDTKLPCDHFTHIFTNFGPMLFPKPDAMLSECKRMLRSGGACAFTTWQHVGWHDDLKAAMQSMPELPEFPTMQQLGSGFGEGAWYDPDFIREKLVFHGFTNIKIESVPNTTVAANSSELKALLTATVGIITSKVWNQEQRDEFANSTLNARIEDWFEDKYKGGPVAWHWIALVVTSTKP